LRDRTGRFRELVDEFRLVMGGKKPWIDALLPSLVFLILNATAGVWPAIAGASGLAILLVIFRLVRRRPVRYALGGLGGALLAAGIAIGLSRGEGYFVPGMVSGAGTSLACLVTVIIRRPLAAWTSAITRRWPLAWYWHPRVRPAYSEVTLLWFVSFAARLPVQVILFQRGATLALSTANLILGWPSLVLLLAGSYLFGLWRLRKLEGPSVEEYRRNTPPPWTGQQRGF